MGDHGKADEPACTSRRGFLRRSAAAAGSFGLAGSFGALLGQPVARAASTAPRLLLSPDAATGLPLLRLPAGFRYSSFGWAGEPMSDGVLTPSVHDGMAVIAENDGIVTLCRNHEVNGHGLTFGEPDVTYDPSGPAGCTMLRFDTRTGRWVDSRVAIAGTSRNCAGGLTPWNSWLTCEETVFGPGDFDIDNITVLDFQQTHGWVFEVPAEGPVSPEPLRDMGRFVHEAVAVDPETGFVYETEDRDTAGFYRFIPNVPGQLAAGGRLQMMKVRGQTDLSGGQDRRSVFDVEWVNIDDPTRAHSPGTYDTLGVFNQGKQQDATTFARLEGCWYGNDAIYFNATSGGAVQKGQIWEYRPADEQLRLLFESPGADVLDMPDNLAISPRGGLMLCEDGDVIPHRMHGMTPQGHLMPLIANNILLDNEVFGLVGDFRSEEFAGATFCPEGRWLFVNIQTPGVTLAITGPWEDFGL